MGANGDRGEAAWRDVLSIHQQRVSRRTGQLYAVVLSSADDPPLGERPHHLDALIDHRRIIEARTGRDGVVGEKPAILLALTSILVEDPDATVMLFRTLPADVTEPVCHTLACGLMHVMRDATVVVRAGDDALLAQGRTLFKSLATEMPLLARLFALCAEVPATSVRNFSH